VKVHLPALPGQPVTKANSTCAFTNKVVRFPEMMEGIEVIVYGDPRHDDLPNYVACYDEQEPPEFTQEGWAASNEQAIVEIAERAEPGDLLALPGGICQAELVNQLPELTPFELGIGYPGSMKWVHRVFESYAWMNATYGREASGGIGTIDPPFYDTVIPGYFNLSEFPDEADDMGYLLYVGRLIERKGVSVAIETARRLGMTIILAGEGDYRPRYKMAEYIGAVEPEERNALMAGATALLAPTTYSEPFGNIVPEAHLSAGCPTVTTDFGAFPETNIHGLTGYRARTLGEFCDAVERCSDLDRSKIRAHAVANYTYDAVRPKYEAYFDQLATLADEGWFSDWSGLSTHRYGPLLDTRDKLSL
jgi:glycosyltransferase involved in cell wall biosynthesis